MAKVRLSHRAVADLADIFRYGKERFGEAGAREYVVGLRAATELIGRNAYLGSNCDAIRYGYRSHRKGSHVLFYTAAKSDVLIVRVLHARMDFYAHL